VKDRDACWTVFAIDPLAVPLSALAARFKAVTPNRLTGLSVLLALGAAALFATRQIVAGALVYQLSFVADCMDGKVASMRQMTSRWGGFFDVSGDTIRFVACFTALAAATVVGGSLDGWHLLPVLLYPCARFGLLGMAEARPTDAGDRGKISVAPRPWDVLRLAPRRATKPGTTVDAEAIALTIGPIAGHVLVGFAVAALLHIAHAAVLFAGSLRAAAASEE
jgi:phosphatidylglycerophosphate synthase